MFLRRSASSRFILSAAPSWRSRAVWATSCTP